MNHLTQRIQHPLELSCFATSVAVGAASAGIGSWAGGRLVTAGASFTRTAVVTCTYGAVDGAATYSIVAAVTPRDNVELTPALVNTALGCASSGIAAARKASFAPTKVAVDWDAVVSKTGEMHYAHVTTHNVANIQKEIDGVFYGNNAVKTTNHAWARAQRLGLKPRIETGAGADDA